VQKDVILEEREVASKTTLKEKEASLSAL